MPPELDEGTEVTLTGTVQVADDAGLLAAPLTGEPCIAHVSHARVWSHLDLAGVLVEDVWASGLVPFVLACDAGELRVASPSFVLDADTVAIVPRRLGHEAAFLRARGLERFLGSTFSRHALVVPGERVTVSGVVARVAADDAEAGYRDGELRTVIVGYASRPLELRPQRR